MDWSLLVYVYTVHNTSIPKTLDYLYTITIIPMSVCTKENVIRASDRYNHVDFCVLKLYHVMYCYVIMTMSLSSVQTDCDWNVNYCVQVIKSLWSHVLCTVYI